MAQVRRYEHRDPSVAAPGTVPTILFEGDDEAEQFLLATSEADAGPALEVYSPNSPLGRALLGAREGGEREYESPNGSHQRVRLIKLRSYDEHTSDVRRTERSAPRSGNPPPPPPPPSSAASVELAATHQAAVGRRSRSPGS